jgi:putative endonuclease
VSRAPTKPVGDRGEAEAARFLKRKGFTILAQGYRCPLGELDLVAQDGHTVVFVEVKARRGTGGDPPQAAVDLRKQRRLTRLAAAYLNRYALHGRACRFDVVAVTFGDTGAVERLHHIENAFEVR